MNALSVKVIPKRVPGERALEGEFNLMPIARGKGWKKVGYGDWGRGRSEYGSVVLGDGEKVLKMHIGKIADDKDPFDWARQKQEAVKLFGEVSPPTMVMVVDGVDGPRPAVVQEQIHGKPIYKASLTDEILVPEVLEDLADIMRLTRNGLNNGFALDLSGLRLKTGGIFYEKLLKMCPIFSDNIMIDNEKKVWLVDNVPAYFDYSKKNTWFKFKRKVEIGVLYFWEGLFLSSKIFCRFGNSQRSKIRS